MKAAMVISVTLSSMIPMCFETIIMLWIFLEMNALIFTFYLANYNEMKTAASYFIMSFAGTTIFLLALTTKMISGISNETLLIWAGVENTILSGNLMAIAMMVKIGAVPFHKWAFTAGTLMKWDSLLLFLTVQKIAPLAVMAKSSGILPLWVGALSAVAGAALMMSSMQMKTLLNSSSLYHNSWLMTAAILSEKILISYFLFYVSVTMIIMMNMKNNTSNQSPQWWTCLKKENPLLIPLLSMAGVPPTLGFTLKICIITTLITQGAIVLTVALISIFMSTILTMFMYMKMASKFLNLMKASLSMKTTNKLTKSSILFMSAHMLTPPAILLMSSFL